jgi:hypothetical protein
MSTIEDLLAENESLQNLIPEPEKEQTHNTNRLRMFSN